MPNLSRDQRRSQIINAAVDLTVKEGLAAATVRRVAAEIDVSPGQIHHHFKSADELRAEAFRVFGHRLEESFTLNANAYSPMDRVLALLNCSQEISEVDVDKLWKEAMFAAREAESVRGAVQDVLTSWCRMLADALLVILEERNITATHDLTAAAGRLIGVAIGRELITDFNLTAMDDPQTLQRYIELELSNVTSDQ